MSLLEDLRGWGRLGGGEERTANGNCDSLDGDADETQNLPAQVKEPLSLSFSFPSFSLSDSDTTLQSLP